MLKKIIKFFVGFCIVLVIINFVRNVFSLNVPQIYFTDFLESLNRISNIHLEIVSLSNLQILTDWGAFDFLRIFLNNIIQIIETFLYICQLILNLIISISQIILEYLSF